MAYLRKEKEIVEMDYPIKTVWADIAKAVTSLEWTVQETNDETHKLKAKTKSGFMGYSSVITIDASNAGEKATRVVVSAETPVTTITGIVDFGKTRERIDLFLAALSKQLKAENPPTAKKD